MSNHDDVIQYDFVVVKIGGNEDVLVTFTVGFSVSYRRIIILFSKMKTLRETLNGGNQ